MDIFTTRIKLKPNVTRKDIWNLIQKWLLKSPHYNINEINYNENDEYFSQEFNNSKLTVLSLNIEKDAILGVRFENKEDNVIWYTDYILCGKHRESLYKYKIIMLCKRIFIFFAEIS